MRSYFHDGGQTLLVHLQFYRVISHFCLQFLIHSTFILVVLHFIV